jgi:hypothetical protein
MSGSGIRPFIEEGKLHIPPDCETKYQWWEDQGQSIWETLAELNIPENVRKHYAYLYWLDHEETPQTKYAAIEVSMNSFTVEIKRNISLPQDSIAISSLLCRELDTTESFAQVEK